MTHENEIADSGKKPATKKAAHHWKRDFFLLCFMLIVALIGMGITQSSENGAWEYWVVTVLIFTGIGIYRDLTSAKGNNEPTWKRIGKQLCHWLSLLIVMKALIAMELYDAISRESASIFALMLLALTSFLAGLHFHWTFAIVGIVLAIMAVVLGTLEQSMLMMWLIMVPVTIAGAAVYYMRGKKANANEGA